MKSSFLDKLVERLDRVDPGDVQTLIERLLRERGVMENVFTALREGLLILDPNGIISFVNPAACSLFGLTADKTTGQNIATAVRGLAIADIANPQAVVSRDMEVFYPENRFLNFYTAPITDAADSGEGFIGYVMLVRDITSSRIETAEAIESEKLNALTFLAAGVAHEIGNPLNSLDIHLQLLSRKLKKLPAGDRQPLEKHLQVSQDEIRRLDGILRQFLQAIRPTTAERKPADLHQLVEESLKLLEPELESRNISIHLDYAEKLPSLLLDGDQIQQAVFNLIKNAYQAVPSEGGAITLKTRVTDYDVQFSVTDNGSGISPENMGSLFEPYRTTKPTGNGLGLLIVRRILREHGGEIEVDSAEGVGTRVLLFFPLGQKSARMLGDTSPPAIDLP